MTESSSKIKKFGFTLAEVLITLTIIGVVAAMTLPTLIQKHQKKVWATKFQQSLSILSQGFQKMMADEGVTNFEDTDWYKNGCMYGSYTKPENSNKKQYACSEIAKKYFKGVKVIGIDESNRPHWNYIVTWYRNDFLDENYSEEIFSDSSSIFTPNYILSNGLAFDGFFIDTNGAAGPNKEGYDIFDFTVKTNGVLLPDVLVRLRADRTHPAFYEYMEDLENGVKEYENLIINQTSEIPECGEQYGEWNDANSYYTGLYEMKYDNEDVLNEPGYQEDLRSASERLSRNKEDLFYCAEQHKTDEMSASFKYLELYKYNLSTELFQDFDRACKKYHLSNYCGAYLYQNNFVMDY